MSVWREAKRRDLFEVGDRVEVIDEDAYDGFGMGEQLRAKHGPGPYVIEDVEPAHAPALIHTCAHPQTVYICGGDRMSGAWFKPLRAPPAPSAAAIRLRPATI